MEKIKTPPKTKPTKNLFESSVSLCSLSQILKQNYQLQSEHHAVPARQIGTRNGFQQLQMKREREREGWRRDSGEESKAEPSQQNLLCKPKTSPNPKSVALGWAVIRNKNRYPTVTRAAFKYETRVCIWTLMRISAPPSAFRPFTYVKKCPYFLPSFREHFENRMLMQFIRSY